MLRRLVVILTLAGVVGAAVRELAPEVRRYLKLRQM